MTARPPTPPRKRLFTSGRFGVGGPPPATPEPTPTDEDRALAMKLLREWDDMFKSREHPGAIVARAIARARLAGAAAERERTDAAYAERNKLALLLAVLCGGTIQHATDAEPGWSNVVLFQTSAGQASFHLHDSELPYALSCSIPMGRYEWDGHTTDEKWERIAKASGYPAAAIRSLAPGEGA